MANKGGIIAYTAAIMFCILIAVVICGLLVYASGCNIVGVTFNNPTARDATAAMIGNTYWGWVVCPFALALAGLLGYVSFEVGSRSHKKIKELGSGYEKIDEKSKKSDKKDK